MSNLEDLVPPLELCKKIPAGEFGNSALVWVVMTQKSPEIWERSKTKNLPLIWKTVPAPTWQEIMEGLNEDMSSIEYRDSSPHWVVNSPYTDTTPTGDNVAEALLRYWLDRKGWNK